MDKKATTTDVARLAGVSQSTVSLILSGRRDISFAPETVRRVYEAAHTLNYQTRRRQEMMKDPSGNLIAVIYPTLDNPYYSTLIQSLENAALSSGYRVICYNTYRDPDLENGFLHLMNDTAFCGAVFTYLPYHHEKVRILSLSRPVVIISDKAQLSDISTVELNSAAAGRLIAEHLLDLGHKSIAFITTPLKASSNTQRIRRLEGLKERLAGTDVRLTVLESREDYSRSYYLKDFEYSVGYGFTEQICMGGERPTAFIGVNDMVAYGILDALKDRDIRVPDQASVCGFDNIFPSRFHSIELTTVDSFLYEKGRDAFELLHRTMQGSTLSQSVFTIEYKPQLIVRKSTGPAPGTDK